METLLGLCCLATIERQRKLKTRRRTFPKTGIDEVAAIAVVWWRSIEMEAIAMTNQDASRTNLQIQISTSEFEQNPKLKRIC